MDYRLEVVGIPVSDVDQAKDFYTTKVGFHLDHDVQPGPEMRVVQMTPPGSPCSVVIGHGIPLGDPGTTKGMQLVVEDIDGGSVIELQMVAPEGVRGNVVVDLGMVEH